MAGLNKDNYISKYGIEAWVTLNKQKSGSIDNYIAKYGLEEGTKRYKEVNLKKRFTLENQIAKYGLEEGTRRYNEKVANDKIKGTLQGYINKYGSEIGKQKYLEKNAKLSVGVDSLRKRGYSEDEIKNIKAKHANNSIISLENLILRYGNEDGTARYEKWKSESRQRSHRTIEFWIAKGYTEEQAKQMVSELQTTSSLDRLISKYGEELGKQKYHEINLRKTKHLGTFKNSISKLEINFFNELSKLLILDLDKGRTCKLVINNNIYFCDYVDMSKNKIIEINGTFWHMKPSLYQSTDVNKVSKKTASEIWENDKQRMSNLESNGFKVLVIWEDDIRKNLTDQLLMAKNFLEKEENEN
jgi:hypothetical protein